MNVTVRINKREIAALADVIKFLESLPAEQKRKHLQSINLVCAIHSRMIFKIEDNKLNQELYARPDRSN